MLSLYGSLFFSVFSILYQSLFSFSIPRCRVLYPPSQLYSLHSVLLTPSILSRFCSCLFFVSAKANSSSAILLVYVSLPLCKSFFVQGEHSLLGPATSASLVLFLVCTCYPSSLAGAIGIDIPCLSSSSSTLLESCCSDSPLLYLTYSMNLIQCRRVIVLVFYRKISNDVTNY